MRVRHRVCRSATASIRHPRGTLLKVRKMKTIRSLIAVAALLPMTVLAADPVEVDYDPPQRLDVRYRLFKTKNTWNFVELDTQTGKLWQVQFVLNDDVNRKKLPMNAEVLAKDGKPGRFTLYPTRNMYNFVLLDQETGKTWQTQWSTESGQGIWPIEQKAEKSGSGWKE
jgi:hypothetical protein